jgi:ribosomal protein L15
MGQKQQKAQMHAREMGFEKYFGKQGLTSASTAKKRTKQINLDDVKANFYKAVPSKSDQSPTANGAKIDLKEYKILGDGAGFKAEITAKGATQSAIDKMAKAGGKIIITETRVAREKPAVKEKIVEKKVVAPKAVAHASVSSDEQKKKEAVKKEKVAKK